MDQLSRYEAYLAGAAAVIAVQDGGYAEVSDDALNAQDVCGPSYAPAFSMSRTDAELLRAAMNESGEATVTLELTYLMIEVDGQQLLEVDKLNGIYKVNGTDMLAGVNSLI